MRFRQFWGVCVCCGRLTPSWKRDDSRRRDIFPVFPRNFLRVGSVWFFEVAAHNLRHYRRYTWYNQILL